MHIWHHAKKLPKSKQYGVNFGLSLSLWDYLFKTAHVPEKGDAIELGYTGDEEMPREFWKQALYPITKPKEDNTISYSPILKNNPENLEKLKKNNSI